MRNRSVFGHDIDSKRDKNDRNKNALIFFYGLADLLQTRDFHAYEVQEQSHHGKNEDDETNLKRPQGREVRDIDAEVVPPPLARVSAATLTARLRYF